MADMFDQMSQKGEVTSHAEFLNHPGKYRATIVDVYYGKTRDEKEVLKFKVSLNKARPLAAGLGVNGHFDFVAGQKFVIMAVKGKYPEYFYNEGKTWGLMLYRQLLADGKAEGRVAADFPPAKAEDITPQVLRQLYSAEFTAQDGSLARSPILGLEVEIEVVAKKTKSGGVITNTYFCVIEDRNAPLEGDWKGGA